jgi:Tol biopolymer transport system component
VGITALALPLSACATSPSGFGMGTTSRVSLGNAGQQIEGLARGLVSASDLGISQSGRWVSFVSDAANLVPHDTNGTAPDVFVRDRALGKTYLMSVDTRGHQAPVFSGDGSDYVAGNPLLASSAPYMAYLFRARQAHSFDRPFLRNLKTGAVTELPHTDNFTQLLAISSNGRYVLMATTDEQFPGTSLWVYDAVTRQNSRLTVVTDETAYNAGSISADGRYVAYDVKLGSLDQNQVFRIDRHQPGAAPVLVSAALDSGRPNGTSANPSMSDDGRYIAFQSNATNLVRGDTNGGTDVFVRDMVAGTTTRVSVGPNGQQADGASYAQSISSDGKVVAFTSSAENLVAGDRDRRTDVFLHSLTTGATSLVSLTAAGAQASENASDPVLSADGKRVAFLTRASLVSSDTNGLVDAYVRDTVAPLR